MTNMVISAKKAPANSAVGKVVQSMRDMGFIYKQIGATQEESEVYIDFQKTFEAALSAPEVQETLDMAETGYLTIEQIDGKLSLSKSRLVTGFSQKNIAKTAEDIMIQVSQGTGTCLEIKDDGTLDLTGEGNRASFNMVGNPRTNYLTAVMYVYLYRYLVSLPRQDRGKAFDNIDIVSSVRYAVSTREEIAPNTLKQRAHKVRKTLSNVM